LNKFPGVIFLLSFFIPFIILVLFKWLNRLKKVRPPFTDKFLRNPGESLNRKVEELNDDIVTYLMFLFITPYVFWTIFSLAAFVENNKAMRLPFNNLIVIIVVLCFMVFFAYKLFRLLMLRKNYRLGYEGEMATGQELNMLMLKGYHVYHDFPAGRFNIDHIVVGANGVFAVETKAKSKPTSGNSNSSAKVIYDGKVLRFPNGVHSDALGQAKRQAQWLSNWLGSAVGESVQVQAAVTLPGWFVERTSPKGIPVLNPKQFQGYLKNIRNIQLTEPQIKRIVHQLEQKCRDVLPLSVAIQSKER